MNWSIALAVTVATWLVLAAAVRPLVTRSKPSPAAARRRVPRRRLAAAALVALALAPAGLVGSGTQERPGPSPSAAPAVPADAVERRVLEHPDDVTARLALARHYAGTGVLHRAVDEYVNALRLDSRNAEAYAALGYLLYLVGRPRDGLWAEDRALSIDPRRTDALYFRGVIRMAGLGCPVGGGRDLRAYLTRAPYGAYRADAETLLASAPALAYGPC